MLNCVHIQGRFTKEPEISSTPKGTLCCSFSLANERIKDEVNYVKCVAFGKTTEIIRQYCHKGSQVIVDGYLKYRTYEGTRGKQEVLEVYVTQIHFCGGTKNSDSEYNAREMPPKQTDEFEEIDDGEDLPF